MQLAMSRVASKLTTSYSQQLEIPPSHFTVPAQRQMSRQSNADQNLNTLPLVILLLFQKAEDYAGTAHSQQQQPNY